MIVTLFKCGILLFVLCLLISGLCELCEDDNEW